MKEKKRKRDVGKVKEDKGIRKRKEGIINVWERKHC